MKLPASICRHHPTCPACPRLGLSGPAPDLVANLKTLCAAQGAPPPIIIEGQAPGSRRRARLAVRGRTSSPKIGLFQAGSHRIVDIPNCPLHHPLINEAAAVIRSAVRQLGIAPYAEGPHRGKLRYLQITVARAEERAQIVYVMNGLGASATRPLAELVATGLGKERVHSQWWNGHSERGNAIFGRDFERLSGEAWFQDEVAGTPCFHHPGGFLQAQAEVFDELARQARAAVPPGARVTEFHCGAGGIGLGLLERVAHLAFNEMSPFGVAGLRHALAQGAAPLGRAVILEGPAEAHLAAIGASDLIIADPPRRGLGPALLDALTASPPQRLVVLHCGFRAFLSDAAHLAGARKMRLVSAAAAELMPWTDQVETLTVWERAR
ncbi:MAG: hypothetical protein KDB53_08790 [Planctomycetes bacterium]|nr:hypothetical protein [Planctomycetota bacterium]